MSNHHCVLRPLVLPLHPYEGKREQHDIHRVGYGLGDLEAHVTRFLEYAASYATVGLGDCCIGGFVYELRSAGDGVELFEIGNYEECRRTTTFEPVPLDFHLYSVSSMLTDPLLKGGDHKRSEGVVKT